MEEEIHKFYSTLDNAKRQYKTEKKTIIVMVYLNAKVGKEQDSDIASK